MSMMKKWERMQTRKIMECQLGLEILLFLIIPRVMLLVTHLVNFFLEFRAGTI